MTEEKKKKLAEGAVEAKAAPEAVEAKPVPEAVEADIVAAEPEIALDLVTPVPVVPGVEKEPGAAESLALYEGEVKEVWIPKTAIGKKVQAGEITNIDEILSQGLTIMEAGIVNALLPGMSEEVIHVRRVQRTLDSGRRMRFSILAAVGDKNGHVGLGLAKGVEAGPTIKKAINRAKLNLIAVPRACASWECGCGEQHTVPFTVTGKMGSVRITLKPAPKGVGLVVGDNSKKVLEFAGIKDVWEFSRGHRRTVVNQAFTVYDALRQLSTLKTDVAEKQHKKHKKEPADN
jgi:small subunit ribosomal protein S5